MPSPAKGALPELSPVERLKKIEELCVQARAVCDLPELMQEIYQLSRGYEIVTVRWFGMVREVKMDKKMGVGVGGDITPHVRLMMERGEWFTMVRLPEAWGSSGWESKAFATPEEAVRQAESLLRGLSGWLSEVTMSPKEPPP